MSTKIGDQARPLSLLHQPPLQLGAHLFVACTLLQRACLRQKLILPRALARLLALRLLDGRRAGGVGTLLGCTKCSCSTRLRSSINCSPSRSVGASRFSAFYADKGRDRKSLVIERRLDFANTKCDVPKVRGSFPPDGHLKDIIMFFRGLSTINNKKRSVFVDIRPIQNLFLLVSCPLLRARGPITLLDIWAWWLTRCRNASQILFLR